MEIHQIRRPAHLEHVEEDVLGFDLEMANSFYRTLPVICMIGTEQYLPSHKTCLITLASITERHEEEQLIRWFLDHLRTFQARQGGLRLLTFSGEENDLPWVRERIQRYQIEPEACAILDELESLDLRLMFQGRTQTDRISLKRLEEQFGIHRESELSSRQVSQLLTKVVGSKDPLADIPEEIGAYLIEDVHHLLLILDQWDTQSLQEHFLSEYEYLNRLTSLSRLGRRVLDGPKGRLKGALAQEMRGFLKALGDGIEGAVARGTFSGFTLPGLPELDDAHSEAERLERRFRNVADIQVGGENGDPYRLGTQLSRPKGTLAVVENKGRVLMIRRADHLKRAPGLWGLPGGVLETGETPGEGAVRELREEVNLRGEPLHLLGTTPSVSGHYELFWTAVRVEDVSTMAPDTDEVAEARWVAPEDLGGLEPLIPGAVEGFRQFLGNQWGNTRRSKGGSRNGR